MTPLTTRNTAPYPYKCWEKTFLRCVNLAISKAWQKIPTKSLTKLSEDKITVKLQAALNRLMGSEEEPGFNCCRFQTITRGEDLCNYNGRSINKQPDLVIRRIERKAGIDTIQDALFIECKIIDRNKTSLQYIEEGMYRFVCGDYAWAMPHAMMLGYVKNNRQLPQDLQASFRRSRNNTVRSCCPKRYSTFLCMCCTVHGRGFKHDEYGDPGDIQLFHIWLTV